MARAIELDETTILDALEVITGRPWREDRRRAVRTYAAGRIDYSPQAREVYSYGRHFPLVRFVPRRLNGAADLFVINGDRWPGWPSRTRDHQEITRRAIGRFPGIGSIVLPFSALDGAGIAIDSVRPIHIRPDANWTETREVRTLAEMPRHERTVSYYETLESATLDGVPENERKTWRRALATEAPASALPDGYAYLDKLPDPDGVYRWKEWRTRNVEPDPDGVYRWEVRIHRLGDSLFSAVRATAPAWRNARPFESERDNARVTRALHDSETRRYCADAPDNRHESGPAGACIHCGQVLRAQEIRRTRARYLSSFDVNESPALYFLAQVPRDCGDTVETALDSLAPRAVHAAYARGRDVRRQGDIFLIDTNLTREDLAGRGATFGRLTQWTRDARARAGEVNYKPRQTAAERRREKRYAAQDWRRTYRALAGEAMSPRLPDAGRHAFNRAAWEEMRARHAAERTAAILVGADLDTREAMPCATCGAAIGEPCRTVEIPNLGARQCGGPDRQRLTWKHSHEIRALELSLSHLAPYRPADCAPATDRGARAQWRKRRAECAAKVETARADLQRALGAPAIIVRPSRTYYARHYYGDASSPVREARASYAARVKRARETLDNALEVQARAEYGRIVQRDRYRGAGRARAVLTWHGATQRAAERYRPDDFAPAAIARRRERARRQIAVYGTAHTATETAIVDGAVYVAGIVRHVPELEPGRFGEPDHRPIVLTAGRWYLAVRNRVPRQRGGAR